MEPEAKRKKAEYLVEYQDDEPHQWNAAQIGLTHDNSAKAVSWIRKNGVNGKTYRVVRVVAGPFTVKTENVVKRSLE